MATRQRPSQPSVPMVFRVAPGSRLRRRDADVVGNELLRLRASGVKLTPENVLAAATRRGSPLRRFFEWNDQNAAHEYRITQARQLLRSIEVTIEDAKGKNVHLRAFYPVVTEGQGKSWQPMSFVFEHTELADQVISNARAQLEGWIERHKRYEWAKQAMPMARQALRFLKRKRADSKALGRKARAA